MGSLLWQRCARVGAVVFTLAALLFSVGAQALTQDITSAFAITKSGFLINRVTGNTYDSTVTLRNTSINVVLAPIAVAISDLPADVTLANATGQTADGKPYVTPMAAGSLLQPGGTLSFVLKFSNPRRMGIPATLRVLYIGTVPAIPPSLISAVATGGSTAFLIGRVDGAANKQISIQAYAAGSCTAGSLVGAAAAGGVVAATTDAAGYFGTAVAGINSGAFVAFKVTAPDPTATSACLVSSRDNDSWPKAFLLDGSPASTLDYIDTPGKARWYKVAITPGQRIDVTLSNLPADYDLAVFKDIGQVFVSQFNPVTAGPADLVKLTAEYAPSAFTPSAFTPSAFTPSAFTPSAFTPSAFTPSAFTPSAFTPATLSPSAFTPSAFTPGVYAPSAFTPSAFTPTPFAPSVFSSAEVEKAFSTAQTRSILSVSARPGTANESTVVNTWNNTGSFYIRVTGRGNASSTSAPFTVTVIKGATTCTNVTDTVISTRALVPASGLKTVLLTDSSRLALDAPLTGSAGGTLRTTLAAFSSRAEVAGVVVDVAADARVSALKTQAANNPACPFAKNLVAQEIKGIVDAYRANPLRYVVIVGNDDAIPFFRAPDESMLGSESGYVPPVESNSPSEASLRKDFVLSQDGYGSKTSISLRTNDYPVPGLAVGRLVETAEEIAGLIEAYVGANGVVVPRSALVTGYDFLEDAAHAVKAEFAAGIGAAPDTLITPYNKSPQDPASWTASQLGTALLGSRHDVVFLAGHFSANSALAADFTTSLLTTDLAASTTDFTNAIVMSAGCHSGYNLVDADGIPGVTLPLDWAQAFARKRATLIAGTGYQYGDTDFLEYSERLYNNLARQLRAGSGPVSVGEALVKAKLDYLALTPDIRGIHEKALLEATLFGLPMLAVNMPSGRGASPGSAGVITPIDVSSGPAATLGLKTYDLGLAPSLTSHTTVLTNVQGGPDVSALWLSGPDGVVTVPAEPALPLMAVNVTPTNPSIVLRGVGFRGGNYADFSPMVPFSGAPTTELRGVHVPFLAPGFYPARPWTVNYFGALSGAGGTALLVTPAQHRAASVVNGTSTQRKFSALDLRLYYSGNLSQAALSDAPSIVGVDAQPVTGGIAFTVQVVGDPAAAIHQVWVTYTSDGVPTWTSLDLLQCVAPLPAVCGTIADSRTWRGQLSGTPSNLKYVVQAASGVGLVALDDNRGDYHGVGNAFQTATTLTLVSPPANATLGDTVSITVALAAGGLKIAGKTVAIQVGGAVQVGTTGSDGRAMVTLPIVMTPGSYQITGSFVGDGAYLASSSSAPFTVSKAVSSLASLAPLGATLTGTLGGTAKALAQVPVSFAMTGPLGSTTAWAITDHLGRAVLPPPGLLPGLYNVTGVSYAGDATYAAANVPLAQAFNVAKTAQSIAFANLADVSFGFSAFSVYATASSGFPVTFTASGACSVTGNLVQSAGLGSCTVTATQPGDAFYAAAAQPRTFTITPASQVITFAPAPTGVTVGQPLVLVGASSASPTAAPSTLPLTYTSLTPSVCTIGGATGRMMTFLTPGVCTVAANQPGNALYNASPQATLSFAVSPGGAPPATFTVTNLGNSGPGSLRDAIAQANAAPGPNIVDFAIGLTGTIVLTGGQIQISGPTQIIGPGAANLTIDGNGVLNAGNFNRIFSIFATDPACPAIDGPDYLVSISGLRLTNGRQKSGGSAGAIFTEHSLVLDSVVIDNSVARAGGGVRFDVQYAGQTLGISNSQFLNNTATELVPPSPFILRGGAVDITERCANATDTPYTEPVSVTIANSEFRGNSVQPVTQEGRGGALRSWSRADIVITDSIFVDNHVDAPNPPTAGRVYNGGAFDGSMKSLRIERSEIAENSANDATGADVTRSGGLHMHNSAVDRQSPAGTMAVKIIDSTISGNLSSATAGAMVAFGNTALELVNTTVSDNFAAPTRTGGIVMSSGATYPVSGNITARPTLSVVSSILANNSSNGGDLATNTITMPTFTINATNSLMEKLCATCSIFVTGTGNLLGIDPMLAPLAANGGPSRTHALLPGSPAINAGSNPLGLATDQRGIDFPRVNGGAADMGAYESP